MKLTHFITSLLFVFTLMLLLPYAGLAQKPKLIPNQQGHLETIIGMSTSPNNQLLATIGKDKQIILWDYKTTKLLQKMQHETGLKKVWFPDNQEVATLGDQYQVQIRDVNTGLLIRAFKTTTEAIQDYAFSSDHRLMALQQEKGTLTLWNLETGAQLWEVTTSPVGGILHFSKDDQTIFLRDELGKILSTHKMANGADAQVSQDFFQPSFTPADDGIKMLGDSKVIYSKGDQVQVVYFSKALSHTINNRDQSLTLVQQGNSFDRMYDPEFPLPVLDFAFSAKGDELFLKRFHMVMWATGTMNIEAYFNLSRLDLKTGVSEGDKIREYNSGIIHLTKDEKFILTTDDVNNIHYRNATNPDKIVKAILQEEIFHTKATIAEDLSSIGIHRFDQHGLRTLDLQSRTQWEKAPQQSSLAKGPKLYLAGYSAYKVNSAAIARSKPRILINLRKVPYSPPIFGGPQDYVALLDHTGKEIKPPFNFYADEVSFSSNEQYAIAKWYLEEAKRDFDSGVANIYGDSRRHGAYELGAWDYEGGQLIKSDNPYDGDTYAADFLQTPTGINRFLAFHFADANTLAINRVDQQKLQSWDLSTGKLLAEKKWPNEVAAVDFLPNGQEALVSFTNGKMVRWNAQNGAVVKEWNDIGTFYSIEASANNTYATLRQRGSVAIFDLNKGQLLFQTGQDRPGMTTMFGLQGVYPGRKMGEVSDVQVDDKTNRAVTAHFDGTISFWDLEEGKELASLYTLDSTDWVVLSPNGLFDATPGAMNSLYFVVGTETIELEQLKERYFEPGLLQKLMGFSTEQIRPVDNLDKVDLYPRITEATQIKNNILQVKLEERNGGIGPVSVFVNGKEVTSDANPLPKETGAKRSTDFTFDLKPFARLFLKDPSETNMVTLRAYNEEGWLKSAAYNIPYQYQTVSSRGSGSADKDVKLKYDPKLYVVCIGTSEYTGDQLDLRYADQDARSIAEAMNASGAALFSAKGDSVEVHCLTTDTKKVVGDAINWNFSNKPNIKSTFQSIAAKAKAEDILVVYLSGHGVTYGSAEKAQFHYLTQGVASEDLSDSFIREAYTLSGDELTGMINTVPALKQVLIIDACNSGQIVASLTEGRKSLNSSQIRALDRMKDRTGMFVISGSAANKVSYEASQYGQGLLTFSLLQGMKLVTAKNMDAHLDVMQLFQHARDQVPELAKGIGGIQRPVLAFPSNGSSFDIGIVNDQVKIPIANKKPVFIRNVFLEEKAYDDVIRLGEELATYFQKISSKGANAEYIFVDVNQFDNAYSVKGIYNLSGNTVNLKGALFKGDKNMGTFELKGRKDDVKTLVEDLVSEVEWLVDN